MNDMTLTLREEDGGAIFRVAGRLMYETDSHAFQESLTTALNQGKRWFVVDLSGVIGLSSTGLGILIAAHRKLQGKDIPFLLADLSEKVRSVLQITRLNTIFEVYENVDKAVASVKQR